MAIVTSEICGCAKIRGTNFKVKTNITSSQNRFRIKDVFFVRAKEIPAKKDRKRRAITAIFGAMVQCFNYVITGQYGYVPVLLQFVIVNFAIEKISFIR